MRSQAGRALRTLSPTDCDEYATLAGGEPVDDGRMVVVTACGVVVIIAFYFTARTAIEVHAAQADHARVVQWGYRRQQ